MFYMTRTAYIMIKDFGSLEEQLDLANKFNTQTSYKACVQNNAVLIQVNIEELSEFFTSVQSKEELNWIEYTVFVDFPA